MLEAARSLAVNSLSLSVDSLWNVLEIVMMHDSLFFLIQDISGDF